jgi:hypothetical protein
VIREEDGVPVRIRDVGWVELGAADYQPVTRYSGDDVVGVAVVRQSRSNELDVAQRVREAAATIAPTLPPGVEMSMGVDFTIFVRESVDEVYFTLWIAFAAVVLVNLFFLQSKTTTAIASVAIPVAVIGTFAALEVLGFSLNVLTLSPVLDRPGGGRRDRSDGERLPRQELGEAGYGGAQGPARGRLPDRHDRAGGGARCRSPMSGDTGLHEFAISLRSRSHPMSASRWCRCW